MNGNAMASTRGAFFGGAVGFAMSVSEYDLRQTIGVGFSHGQLSDADLSALQGAQDFLLANQLRAAARWT
jgi:hypothetical protein